MHLHQLGASTRKRAGWGTGVLASDCSGPLGTRDGGGLFPDGTRRALTLPPRGFQEVAWIQDRGPDLIPGGRMRTCWERARPPGDDVLTTYYYDTAQDPEAEDGTSDADGEHAR